MICEMFIFSARLIKHHLIFRWLHKESGFPLSRICLSHGDVMTWKPLLIIGHFSLQWRHNWRDSVSNHQLHYCLLNRLFRRRSKKTSKLRVTGLCAENSPGTGEFPAQMASNAENVSILWRHHADRNPPGFEFFSQRPVMRNTFPYYGAFMCPGPRVEVTKAPFVHFSVREIFDRAKVHVRFFKSHPYVTDVMSIKYEGGLH